MNKKEIKKIVLAYSGGLDTSIIIPWLKENYNNPEIIAVAADVGQGDELEGLQEKAIKTGASKLYIEDMVDEMVDDVIIPSMMMGAKYEDYLLGTAFARPIIAKHLVEIAQKEGADAIAHGCTGKGNDQVRFELATLFKIQRHTSRNIRRLERRNAHFQKARFIILRLIGQILQIQALVAQVPQVFILGHIAGKFIFRKPCNFRRKRL